MTGFWVYMLFIVLLIPAIMLVFGRRFSKRAPKKINYLFGYRTGRSMKNQETWEFAHHLIGRLWLRTGVVLMPVSAAAMAAVAGRDTDTVSVWGTIAVLVQTVILVLTVIPVERALKKNFDETGQRRQ